MRPTNPKPITPMPTRSLAPRTRFQDAAVNAAAADPLLMKLRRVNSCLGCCDVACNDWFIIQNEVVMTWRFPGHVRSVNERNRFSRLSRESRRSEEHTSELQSPDHLVCRLLLEKKNNNSLETKDQQRADVNL